MKRFFHSTYAIAALAFLVGGLVVLGIRFVTFQPEHVHYHANFSVFINGQRQQFSDPLYYSEVEAGCSAEKAITPHERAHMHDGVNDVVHVEDHVVTWGHFFQNLGWVVDFKVIRTLDSTYLADGQNRVSFILNGRPVDSAMSQVIGDNDRLLVDFGSTSSSDLQKEYDSVASTARRYDVTSDPKSCGAGQHGPSWSERFKHLF